MRDLPPEIRFRYRYEIAKEAAAAIAAKEGYRESSPINPTKHGKDIASRAVSLADLLIDRLLVDAADEGGEAE